MLPGNVAIAPVEHDKDIGAFHYRNGHVGVVPVRDMGRRKHRSEWTPQLYRDLASKKTNKQKKRLFTEESEAREKGLESRSM